MTAAPRRSAVSGELAAELPGLRMWEAEVPGGDGRSGAGLRRRLRVLSDRVTGAGAMALRGQPVPHAYRVLFRHLGLDPDERHTPVEQAMVDRLAHGGFRSRSRVRDALLVALVETGVPVWALDAAALRGPLALRLGVAGDAFVPTGRVAVADEDRAVAELFGPVIPGAEVTRATAALRLYVVAAPGVPEIHAEEALEGAVIALQDG